MSSQMTPADRAVTIMKDARFKQARKFLKEGNYEDSIDIFASLVQYCNDTFGEMSVESAAAWYEYGNVLLLKEEENPSNGLLGNVSSDPDQPPPEDEDVGDEEEEENGDAGGDQEEGEGEEEADEVEGDLQIAWEALDVARATLSKQEDAATSILLSDVHVRLGDLNRFNSNSADAIAEYNNALAIRERICKPHDSVLSEVHFSLAVAHIYNASEKDAVEDPLEEKKKALEHYKKAREVIVKWIEVYSQPDVKLEPVTHDDSAHASSSSSSSSSSSAAAAGADDAEAAARKEKETQLADKADLADTLQETIDALAAEIEEMSKGSASSSSNSAAGVTTIGFGQPSGASSSSSSSAFKASGTVFGGASSSSAFTSSSTSVGFGAASSSGVSAVVNEVNTLQVKRKRPVEEAAAAPVKK